MSETMSTSSTTAGSDSARVMMILLFDLVERDDLTLPTSISLQSPDGLHFKSRFVGVNGGGISYQLTPRIEGEDVRIEAEMGIEEAVSRYPRFDVLLIPGGPGTLEMENEVVQAVGRLADSAHWVIAFSLGANLLASSGRLDGKEATTHHDWAFGDFLDQWPAVRWHPKMPLVRDGKYITAYTIPKSKNVTRAAKALLAAMGEVGPRPEIGRTSTEGRSTVNTDPSTPPPDDNGDNEEEISRWKYLLERLHLLAQHKISTSGVSVDTDLLSADPFIRPAAAPLEIHSAEDTLGVTLPADYKSFLRASNGMGFSGTTDIPGLVRVADLRWEDGEEVGVESLRLEVPVGSGGGRERTELAFEKVLRISDPDEDQYVYLIEPAFVARAKEEVARRRGVVVVEAGVSDSDWM